MSNNDTVVSHSIRLSAKIGETNVPVTALNMGYSVNSIPMAKIVLPLGKDSTDTSVSSPANKLVNSLNIRTPMSVYISVDGSDNVLIFKGYTHSSGFERHYDAASFSVSCLGVLDDLQSTSAFSSRFAVNTPADLFSLSESSVIGATELKFILTPDGMGRFVEEEFKEGKYDKYDIWDVMKNEFIALGSAIRLSQSAAIISSPTAGVGQTPTGQEAASPEAIAILKAAKGGASFKEQDINDILTDSIAKSVISSIYYPDGGATIWSRLVGIASSWFIAVLPFVDTFKAVPNTPCLAMKSIKKWLYPSEYSVVSMSAMSKSMLRGAIITSGVSTVISKVNNMPQEEGRTVSPSIRVEYDGAKHYSKLSNGLWLMVQPAPSWIVMGDTEPNSTDNIVAKTGVPSSGTNKDSSANYEGEGEDSPAAASYKAIVKSNEEDSLPYRFARSFFIEEVFKDRKATLAGKLRFDLCPGTNVLFSVPQIGADSGEIKMAGRIDSLEFNINVASEQPVAETILHISCLRTEAEDAVCPANHPIYEELFTGEPLVADLADKL